MDKQYKLIIFDMDGTLADRDTGELLPGVHQWFWDDAKTSTLYAIASNQGGVGLRYWMESKKFGEPEKYPTEQAIWDRISSIIEKLPIEAHSIISRVCFAYQSKSSGKIAPVPPDVADICEWSIAFRKPSPGMLLDAMRDAKVSVDETLMVGDSQEDLTAALAAGCHFQWAWEFFKRDKPEA